MIMASITKKMYIPYKLLVVINVVTKDRNYICDRGFLTWIHLNTWLFWEASLQGTSKCFSYQSNKEELPHFHIQVNVPLKKFS